MAIFRDRIDAGRQLADALSQYAHRPDVIVLGLPRGGVPVACEVASRLDAPMEMMIVRKLGHPRQEELAIGAIASGGVRVLNTRIRVPPEVLEEITERELRELRRRERSYRGDRPAPSLEHRCVILVDDGLATGSTMHAAVDALRQQHPDEIVVAVPVAPPGAVEALERHADAVVCVEIAEDFVGVGMFYDDFSQTTDEQVRELLHKAWQKRDTFAGSVSRDAEID